jgi:hypothetical protein
VVIKGEPPKPALPLTPSFESKQKPEKKIWESVLIGGVVVAGAGLGLYWLKNLSDVVVKSR